MNQRQGQTDGQAAGHEGTQAGKQPVVAENARHRLRSYAGPKSTVLPGL